MTDFENTPPTDETPSLPDTAVGVPVTKQVITDDDFEDPQAEPVVVSSAPVEPEPSPDVEVQESAPAENADKETAEDEEKETEALLFDVEPNKLKIDPERPIYIRVDPKERGIAALSILPTVQEDLSAYTDSLKDVRESELAWLFEMGAASDNALPGTGYLNAALRKGARWVNQVPNPETHVPLNDHRNAFKIFDQPGTRISGYDAIEMFSAGTNLGRPVTIPLWHSGFWIKLRAPSAAYLADIDRALAFSREEIGLEVYGAIGANDRMIFDEILIDAALKLVAECNIPIVKTPLELKELIRQSDIDTLIWGMAQAAFPDGCEIAIPCPSCRHVEHVKANLLRMRFVDESRLTQAQIRLMSKGISHKTTVEELKKYQEEFTILNTDTWEWNGRKFSFKTPTIEEYLTSGREYITSVGRALTETLREDFADDYRRGQGMKSILNTEDVCRFAHFIREIRIPNTNPKGSVENYGVVSDSGSIIDILRVVSGDYEASNDIIVAINDYLNDSINTLIGFPNVSCPGCKKFYLSKSGEETIVVPFNTATGFFTLAQHKISEAGSEPLTKLRTLGLTGLLAKGSVAEGQG